MRTESRRESKESFANAALAARAESKTTWATPAPKRAYVPTFRPTLWDRIVIVLGL